MVRKNPDLHGSAPDHSGTALIIVDMIADLEGVDHARALLRRGLRAAERISALKRALKRRKVPVIYANDNFGRWKSDFRALVDHCLKDGVLGKPLVERLLPGEDDYFVLKPKHSAFFSTTLDTLLSYLGTRRLILTGMTANQCVLFTANDAHMRDFDLFIPRDCLVSRTDAEEKAARFHFERILGANTAPSVRRAYGS